MNKNLTKIIISVLCLISFNSQAEIMLRTSPIILVVGGVNGEVDYGVTDKISVGFGGLSWSAEVLDVEFSVTEVHARVDYWMQGVFKQGWYFNGSYSSLTMELSSKDVLGKKFEGDITGAGFLLGSGYHWQWDSFHLEFGAQVGFYDFDSSLELKADDGEKLDEDLPLGASAGMEFNLGWVF